MAGGSTEIAVRPAATAAAGTDLDQPPAQPAPAPVSTNRRNELDILKRSGLSRGGTAKSVLPRLPSPDEGAAPVTKPANQPVTAPVAAGGSFEDRWSGLGPTAPVAVAAPPQRQAPQPQSPPPQPQAAPARAPQAPVPAPGQMMTRPMANGATPFGAPWRTGQGQPVGGSQISAPAVAQPQPGNVTTAPPANLPAPSLLQPTPLANGAPLTAPSPKVTPELLGPPSTQAMLIPSQRQAAQSPGLQGAQPVAAAIAAAPDAITNPNGARVLDSETFRGTVGQVSVTELAKDETVRGLAGDTAMAALAAAVERRHDGVAAHLSAKVRKQLALPANATLADLNDDQKTQLRDALINERMDDLRALGMGNEGVVPQSRLDKLYTWFRRFDNDSPAGQVRIATEPTAAQNQPGQPATPGSAGTITAAGQVLKKLIASDVTPVEFNQDAFIRGFGYGAIDPVALRSNAAARRVLANAGILDRLEEAAANHPNEPVRLTVPQLQTLFRAVDKVDKNHDADSFIARLGVRSEDSVELPFDASTGDRATDSGRVVAALNAVFKSDYKEEERAPQSPYEPPPPSATDVGDLSRTQLLRLSNNRILDHDTFSVIARDSRINLDNITDADRAALASAGLPIETLLKVAAPNHVIGGPNAEMEHLYAKLRAIPGSAPRRGSTSLMLTDDNGFAQTNTGRALSILERYMNKHEIVTQDRLAADLDGTSFDVSKLDQQVPRDVVERLRTAQEREEVEARRRAEKLNLPFNINVPNPLKLPQMLIDRSREQPVTYRELLAKNGFDVPSFEAWLNERPGNRDSARASAELFNRLRTLGAYEEPRKGTISLSTSVDYDNGRSRELSSAGRVLDIMNTSGYLSVTEQRQRGYFDLKDALVDGAATEIPDVPVEQFMMIRGDDCLRRVQDTVMSGPNHVVMNRNGVGHWMATKDNTKGWLSGKTEWLQRGRMYLDYQLIKRNAVGTGVTRLNGRNPPENRDGATDHYITIIGRHRDEANRVYYTYLENGKHVNGQKYRGRLYVDRRTGMLFALSTDKNTVGGGGYQVSHFRGNDPRSFLADFRAATGADPRTLGADLNAEAIGPGPERPSRRVARRRHHRHG